MNSSILIVDDNPVNLDLLGSNLSQHGYTVFFAYSGETAIERASKIIPDLILLDIKMSDMSGFEVCRFLKEDIKTKDIPIIFISALADNENIVEGFKSGGVDYITKPFNVEELLVRVSTHIELFTLRRAVERQRVRLEDSQKIAKIGQWELNIGKKNLYWTEEVFNIFEVDSNKQEASYELFINIIHPDDRKMVDSAYKNSLINKNPYDIDHRLLMADGRIKYVHESCRTDYNEYGEPLYSIGTVQDVTSFREVEEKLRITNEKLQLLMRSIPSGVVVHNASTEIILCNDMAEKLLGLSHDQIIGKKNIDFRWNFIDSNGNHVPVEEYPVNKVISSKATYSFELGVYRPETDDIICIWGNAVPLFNYKEEIDQVIVCFTDITELKKTQEELIRVKEDADKANQAKSLFVANMSHEIRTPLNSIIGFSEILRKKTTDSQNRHYIELICESGKALLSLINDILDISKIESGKMELKFSNVSVYTMVSELITIFSPKIKQKNLLFDIKLDKSIPVGLIMDETRLRQVLINLIGNAIKFTNSGFIRLSIHCEYTGKDVNRRVSLVIKIIDSGIGIPDESIEKIFGAFEQLRGHKQEQYGGTGLGLAITKNIVNMMGGYITVESKEGTGTTFKINLPDIEISSKNYVSKFHEDYNSRNIEFEPASILIVDDQESNREILRITLSEWDFTIHEAENGKEAINKAIELKPSIILLDMKMPELSGDEAAEILKKDERTRELPIISITATALKQDVEAISKNCDAYIKKPVDSNELIKTIMKFLPYRKLLYINEVQKVENKVITYPTADKLKNIYELAKIGDMNQLVDKINKINKNGNYSDFADRIVKLAISFNIGEIISFLDSLQKNGKK